MRKKTRPNVTGKLKHFQMGCAVAEVGLRFSTGALTQMKDSSTARRVFCGRSKIPERPFRRQREAMQPEVVSRSHALSSRRPRIGFPRLGGPRRSEPRLDQKNADCCPITPWRLLSLWMPSAVRPRRQRKVHGGRWTAQVIVIPQCLATASNTRVHICAGHNLALGTPK
jgi:hypothetical protein